MRVFNHLTTFDKHRPCNLPWGESVAKRSKRAADAADYFHDGEPLGPTVTPEDFNEAAYRNLFDRDNLIYKKMTVDELDGPIMVVGRRGSGKTAFLKSTHFVHPSSIVIEFVPNETFRYVVHSIENLAKAGGAFVEDVRDLWNYLFWISAFYEIYKKHFGTSDYPELETIGRFLHSVGIDRPSEPYTIFRHIVNLFEKRYRIEGTFEILKNTLQAQGPGFDQALEAAQDFLEKNDLHVFFLLDNLEDFQLEREGMTRAISGLTKCVAEFRNAGDRHHLRWCIPSELYHTILAISKNPLKDFSQQLLLHWHARELLQLAASRYSTYIRIHEPDFHKRKIERLDLRDRKGVTSFWRIVLPDKVMNGFNMPEDPVGYILRHTQLLPRQFLRYLNNIISFNVREYGSRTRVEAEAIPQKVRETEGIIVQEICTAYNTIYPDAYATCEATISSLPYVFKYGELHRIFNHHGKKVTAGISFDDFRRMMIEIGAIGVVNGETDYYYTGLFEYTEPFRLNTSSDDLLCLHPVFFRTFRAKTVPKQRPVYPYGTDPDSPDKRSL
jgi:hypothetical protein